VRFQTIHQCVVAAGALLPACLTFEILYIFIFAVMSIPDQRVDPLVRNKVVQTI
jgi:hypothetical protein